MKNIRISEEIKKALDLLGYTKWTKIQDEVIPLLLEGKNVMVKSQTGSGKTLAFVMPICESVVWEKRHPQALVLSCTRELAMQVKEEFDYVGKYKKLKVQCVYGKENIENQKASLRQQCHVLVATPGRLLDLLQQEYVSLEEVKTIIIDEADYMLDLGFWEDVEKILQFLPTHVQIALFSATYPSRIKSFIYDSFQIDATIEMEEHIKIEHYYKQCEDSYDALKEALQTLDVENALVFCERKEEVEHVYRKLVKEGFPCARIHGDLKQKDRFHELTKYKKGEVRLLIASDVAARGIDIPKVSHVFHYGNLHHLETYIHRSGRSGRMEESGNSIVLFNAINEFYTSLIEQYKMKSLEEYKLVKENKLLVKELHEDKQKAMKASIERIYINAGSEKKIRAMDIIGALCSLEEITKEDIGVIEVLRNMSYVEIYHQKAHYVVEAMQNKTIKKKKVKVEIAK